MEAIYVYNNQSPLMGNASLINVRELGCDNQLPYASLQGI